MTESCRDKPSPMGQAEWERRGDSKQRQTSQVSWGPGLTGSGPQFLPARFPRHPPRALHRPQEPLTSSCSVGQGPRSLSTIELWRERRTDREANAVCDVSTLDPPSSPSPFPCSPPTPAWQRQGRGNGWSRQGTSSSGSPSDSSQDTPSSCCRGLCSCFSELLPHSTQG